MLQTVLDGGEELEHEIELVFLAAGSWPAELSARGFAVEVLDAGRMRQPHRLLATVVSLARLMRRRDPDLIVNWIGKAHLYSAPAATLAGMRGRVVWWQHQIATGHWIDRLATRLPALAVGTSSKAAARAQQRLRPRRRTFTVEPGTAPPSAGDHELAAALELPAGVPVVGIVGRLQEAKGQDRLLRAHRLLRDRGLRLHTLVVGGDAHGLATEYASSLPLLARELEIEDEVTFTGHVPDAGPYISRMDLLVNACELEGFGLVLLEAMSRGVAVVAVGAAGPTEIIEHGETGVLVDSSEPEQLAATVGELLADPQRRGLLGAAGRERFEHEYTDVAMRRRLFERLGELIGAVDPNSASAAPVQVTIVAHDIGPVGGMERQLVQLISGLRRLGHPVTVIGRVCELPAGVDVEFRRVPGIGRPFLLAYPWFLLAGSLAVQRRARGIVQSTGAIVLNRVDVIAVHYCHAAGLATPSRNTPLRRLYIRLVAVLDRVAERICYERNRGAVYACVSGGVAAEMRRHYPSATRSTVTIHNGVDLDAFTPGARAQEAAAFRAELGLAPGRLLASFVGSEWERKGLEHAIGALARAPEWDLLVAGAGDGERYRSLAASLGVGEAVHMIGVTRDVPLVLAASDALVFPSSYEAFPLVVLEAAASGLPILTTPLNGVTELIEDGRSGFLVEQTPASIAARLRELAADRALRETMGAAVRTSVMDFSWARMVQRHHELYQSLARERGRGRAYARGDR
jgi:glycosyltransferase involved in cell wall biosynthesis